MKLSTIGYENKTVDEFLGELRDTGVQLLIDVRAVAASRRPGFSKTAMANALREQGIDYLHLRALGTPKAGRDAARKGRVAEMRTIYEEHLQTLEAEVALEQADAAAQERHAALLCYEKDADCCHRAIIVEKLVARRDYTVENI